MPRRQNSIGWCNDQTRLLQACGTSFFIYEPYTISETTAKPLCGMCCITCCPPPIGAHKSCGWFLLCTSIVIDQSWSQVRLHTYASPLTKIPSITIITFPPQYFWYTHTRGMKLHTGKFSIGSLMKKRQYGYTVVSRLSGSRELAIPPVIISAASSLKFIAGFSAHHMYRREKALWPAKNSNPGQAR